MAMWRKVQARLLFPRAARRVARECEAFLKGTYLEQAARERSSIPAWALLNTVAHGDLARIRATARSGAGALRWALPLGWSRASRELASEVADLVGDDEHMLESVQLAVLVPLELELIKEHGGETDLTAAIAWAREALRSASW